MHKQPSMGNFTSVPVSFLEDTGVNRYNLRSVPNLTIRLCCTPSDAVKQFNQHGFCLLDRELVNLPLSALQALEDWCKSYEPSFSNRRDDVGLRYSMNNSQNCMSQGWQPLIHALFRHGPFSETIDGIVGTFDLYGRWYADVFGGDAVLPSGPGMPFHSDHPGWTDSWSGPPSVLACSVYLEDATVERAPLALISKSTCLEMGIPPQSRWDYGSSSWNSLDASQLEASSCIALMPRGSVLIRDVHIWHTGFSNQSRQSRLLPAVRLIHKEHIGNFMYRPQRVVPDSLFRQLFGDPELTEKLQYLWRYDEIA